MTSIDLRIAPGLAFRFEAQPEELGREIASYLRYFEAGAPLEGDDVVRVSAASPPTQAGISGRVVLEEEGLIVRRMAEVTRFEIDDVVGWCGADSGLGGIFAERPSESAARNFVGLALAPLMIALAEPRGWQGLHAAAVSIEGRGILLPGPSGAGKSTIFRNCRRAGFEALSDDLVWLRASADGPLFRIFPFPRGMRPAGGEDAVPVPSVVSAATRAIVCPGIVDRDSSRLVAIDPSEALGVLLAQSAFIGAKPAAGARFRQLVRLAHSVPCHRLEAGRRPEEVAGLLRGHLAKIAAASG